MIKNHDLAHIVNDSTTRENESKGHVAPSESHVHVYPGGVSRSQSNFLWEDAENYVIRVLDALKKGIKKVYHKKLGKLTVYLKGPLRVFLAGIHCCSRLLVKRADGLAPATPTLQKAHFIRLLRSLREFFFKILPLADEYDSIQAYLKYHYACLMVTAVGDTEYPAPPDPSQTSSPFSGLLRHALDRIIRRAKKGSTGALSLVRSLLESKREWPRLGARKEILSLNGHAYNICVRIPEPSEFDEKYKKAIRSVIGSLFKGKSFSATKILPSKSACWQSGRDWGGAALLFKPFRHPAYDTTSLDLIHLGLINMRPPYLDLKGSDRLLPAMDDRVLHATETFRLNPVPCALECTCVPGFGPCMCFEGYCPQLVYDSRFHRDCRRSLKIRPIANEILQLDNYKQTMLEELIGTINRDLDNGCSFHEVQVITIAEPSKFRIISKGDGFLGTALQPMQDILTKAWKASGFGTMNVDVSDHIERISKIGGPSWNYYSVDYKEATDLFRRDISCFVLEEIVKAFDFGLVGDLAVRTFKIPSNLHYSPVGPEDLRCSDIVGVLQGLNSRIKPGSPTIGALVEFPVAALRSIYPDAVPQKVPCTRNHKKMVGFSFDHTSCRLYHPSFEGFLPIDGVFPTYYFLQIPPKGLPQTNGQLMGHILSFVLLCIANKGLNQAFIDEVNSRLPSSPAPSVFWRVPMVPSARSRWLHSKKVRSSFFRRWKRAVAINGDDKLFRCPDSLGPVKDLRQLFYKMAAGIGLVPSVGKNYASKSFAMINARTFFNKREFTYLNIKLVKGFSLKGGDSAATAVEVSTALNKMFDLLPWSVSYLPEAMSHYAKSFRRHDCPNWFLPVHLGGCGIDPAHSKKLRITLFQRRLASFFLEHPRATLYARDTEDLHHLTNLRRFGVKYSFSAEPIPQLERIRDENLVVATTIEHYARLGFVPREIRHVDIPSERYLISHTHNKRGMSNQSFLLHWYPWRVAFGGVKLPNPRPLDLSRSRVISQPLPSRALTFQSVFRVYGWKDDLLTIGEFETKATPGGNSTKCVILGAKMHLESLSEEHREECEELHLSPATSTRIGIARFSQSMTSGFALPYSFENVWGNWPLRSLDSLIDDNLAYTTECTAPLEKPSA
jgi:hypothetical protein